MGEKKGRGDRHKLCTDFISVAPLKSPILGCKAFELWFLDHFLSTLPVHVSPDREQTMLSLFLDMLFTVLANPHILTWSFSCLSWLAPFLNSCYLSRSRNFQTYCIQNRLWLKQRIVFPLSKYIKNGPVGEQHLSDIHSLNWLELPLYLKRPKEQDWGRKGCFFFFFFPCLNVTTLLE